MTTNSGGQAAISALAPIAADERGNVFRLAVGQALAGANATVVYATGAVVGNTLAPSGTLATLPISIFVVGMAVCVLPAGALAQAFGRRAAFLLGSICGVLAGLLAWAAVVVGSFPLFCCGTFFGGAYAAVVLSFRFAAADCVPADRRPRALSMVMAGGLFAGIIGPQMVTYTMDLWPPPAIFAATYLAQAAVAAIAGVVLAGVRLPTPTPIERNGGRPLHIIVRQPRFLSAVMVGIVSYAIMNLLMTSAPLAMRMCGLSQGDANLGLQWHVIAMYAPSFFTGHLITRFGAPRVVAVGLLLNVAAAVVGLTGLTSLHFWATLAILGIGWNLGFVGASAMVLETHRPEERLKVQSCNDFLVFGVMVIASFSSGGLLNYFGWEMVCWVSLPPLIAAGMALWIARAPKLEAANG